MDRRQFFGFTAAACLSGGIPVKLIASNIAGVPDISSDIELVRWKVTILRNGVSIHTLTGLDDIRNDLDRWRIMVIDEFNKSSAGPMRSSDSWSFDYELHDI